jgi:hypothetical protein
MRCIDGGVPTVASNLFKRCYAIEIGFDVPITLAEQDRLACVVLEKLVEEFWGDAALDTEQSEVPLTVVAYPIPMPRK